MEEARKALRDLAGRLRGSLWIVPFYRSLAWLRMIPSKDDVLEAATQLVGWSNNLYGNRDEDREKRRQIIAERARVFFGMLLRRAMPVTSNPISFIPPN